MIARVFRRFQALSIGLLLGPAIVASLPGNAAAWVAAQVPLRSYCAARIVSLSRVGGSAQRSPQPGGMPGEPGGAATIWRYELAGDLPTALSVQLTMQTANGWYSTVAPAVKLLEDNGLYLSAQARFKRAQVHSPAQFFELPLAAGPPKYIWVSQVGYADSVPTVPCPAMWIASKKHGAKEIVHVVRGARKIAALNAVKRLNPSVYDPHARPAVGAVASAKAIPEPASAKTCRRPFRRAKVKEVMPPSYPTYYAENHEYLIASAAVLVEVGPHGSVVGRMLEAPSGLPRFDGNALYAASQSAYSPAIGLCLPVPGYYTFAVEYSPE